MVKNLTPFPQIYNARMGEDGLQGLSAIVGSLVEQPTKFLGKCQGDRCRIKKPTLNFTIKNVDR
ncbi:MAG: hypothetical protein HEQ35_21515 [Gloeotrichia echinulata IR180]